MNIKDYLEIIKFYIGCEVYSDLEGGLNGELIGIELDQTAIVHFYDYGRRPVNMRAIKLKLRPLSDMTQQEKDEEHKIWNSAITHPFTDEMKTIADAKATKYLLSKQLDVFGLKEAGLALDKTKLNNQ